MALLAFSGLLLLATLLCILFVDRPVALYFNAHRSPRLLFQLCASPSLLALPGAALVLGYEVVQRLRGAPGLNHLWRVMSVATLASTAAKDELKFLFGRPWPGTWLHYGIYRFHPLLDSPLFGSFPSGHTAYISAPLCVLWALAPRCRLVCGTVIALVMLGLVCANYHFLSDVLAGLLTGLACAWGSLVLMRPTDA